MSDLGGEEDHRPGGKLPTYTGLTEMYPVSLATAGRTYAALATLGYVYGESGRGVCLAAAGWMNRNG